MGEEPERLRALAESALLRPVRTRTAHGKLFGGGVRIGALEAGELANGILALLAEVERLARERDGAQLALESNAPLILNLTAEVERLTGERDALEARLETRIEDDAVYRVYDEKVAECERLAGRVAALETALRAIASNAEAWHGPVNDDNRHARALVVIARWANDPSSIPAGIAALHVGGSG